jgi:hypothetical protein
MMRRTTWLDVRYPAKVVRELSVQLEVVSYVSLSLSNMLKKSVSLTLTRCCGRNGVIFCFFCQDVVWLRPLCRHEDSLVCAICSIGRTVRRGLGNFRINMFVELEGEERMGENKGRL